MNLLEHNIVKVYSVDDITKEAEENLGYTQREQRVRVIMRVDCYGQEEDAVKIFYKTEWEKVREQGNYMA